MKVTAVDDYASGAEAARIMGWTPGGVTHRIDRGRWPKAIRFAGRTFVPYDYLVCRWRPKRRRPTADERLARFTARFWARVAHRENGCWEWTGPRHAFGYGASRPPSGTHLHGVGLTTHRISWALSRGPIPRGMCVLHRCDNPPCVNPDHLWLGTQTDNVRDRDAKGRGRCAVSGGQPSLTCGKGHERRLLPSGKYYCPTCSNAACAARYRRIHTIEMQEAA